MTAVINDPAPVDEWDTPVDDFKRDHNKRPYIVQADGTRITYTRCSTAADTIDEDFNLKRHDNRNIAYGMAYDQSLVARLIAIGGDPGTWDWPTKELVHEVINDARKCAKAHKGADIGTALHHMTHRLDRGETFNAVMYEDDLTAYVNAVIEAGFEIEPDLVECRMVNDLLKMAGSADRIVKVGGVYRIADIKTGATVDFGGLGWAAQLAAYAGGTLYDVTTEQRLPTPPIDQTVGYIIHLPAGQGRCDIYEVDLAAGYRAAHLANEIRAIRKESKKWITPIVPPATAVAVEGQAGAAVHSAPADLDPHHCMNTTVPDGEHDPNAPCFDEWGNAWQTGDTIQIAALDTNPPVSPTTAVVGAQPVPGPDRSRPGPGTEPLDGAGARRQALRARYWALGELDRKRFDARHIDRDNLDYIEHVLHQVEATAARHPKPSASQTPLSPDNNW